MEIFFSFAGRAAKMKFIHCLIFLCMVLVTGTGCKRKIFTKDDYFSVKTLPALHPLDESDLEFDARNYVRGLNPNVDSREVVIERMNANTVDIIVSDYNIHKNPAVRAWQTRMRYVNKSNKWYLDWIGTRWKCSGKEVEEWHTGRCKE